MQEIPGFRLSSQLYMLMHGNYAFLKNVMNYTLMTLNFYNHDPSPTLSSAIILISTTTTPKTTNCNPRRKGEQEALHDSVLALKRMAAWKEQGEEALV